MTRPTPVHPGKKLPKGGYGGNASSGTQGRRGAKPKEPAHEDEGRDDRRPSSNTCDTPVRQSAQTPAYDPSIGWVAFYGGD